MRPGVYAGIQRHRASNSSDAAGVLRVSAFVAICTDDSCIASTTLASQDLGSTSLNTPVALQVTWNAGANNYSFQRDSNPAATLAYSVADTLPAAYAAKRLEVSNLIAHCTGGRLPGATSADFDDVMTNALPAQASVIPWQPLSVDAADDAASGSDN